MHKAFLTLPLGGSDLNKRTAELVAPDRINVDHPMLCNSHVKHQQKKERGNNFLIINPLI
jgi:hypothetical protein